MAVAVAVLLMALAAMARPVTGARLLLTAAAALAVLLACRGLALMALTNSSRPALGVAAAVGPLRALAGTVDKAV